MSAESIRRRMSQHATFQRKEGSKNMKSVKVRDAADQPLCLNKASHRTGLKTRRINRLQSSAKTPQLNYEFAGASSEVTVIDQNSQTTPTEHIGTQSCAGIKDRIRPLSMPQIMLEGCLPMRYMPSSAQNSRLNLGFENIRYRKMMKPKPFCKPKPQKLLEGFFPLSCTGYPIKIFSAEDRLELSTRELPLNLKHRRTTSAFTGSIGPDYVQSAFSSSLPFPRSSVLSLPDPCNGKLVTLRKYVSHKISIERGRHQLCIG